MAAPITNITAMCVDIDSKLATDVSVDCTSQDYTILYATNPWLNTQYEVAPNHDEVDLEDHMCDRKHELSTMKISLQQIISMIMYPNENGYHFLDKIIPDMLLELDHLNKHLPITNEEHIYKYGYLDNVPFNWTHDMFVTINGDGNGDGEGRGKLTHKTWKYVKESAQYGYIEALIFIYETILYNYKYPDANLKKFMYDTYTTAAMHGNVIVMVWLWHTCGLDNTDWQFTVDIMTAAATNGHLHIIVWLHNKGVRFTRRKLSIYTYKCPDEHMRNWFINWMDSVGY